MKQKQMPKPMKKAHVKPKKKKQTFRRSCSDMNPPFIPDLSDSALRKELHAVKKLIDEAIKKKQSKD